MQHLDIAEFSSFRTGSKWFAILHSSGGIDSHSTIVLDLAIAKYLYQRQDDDVWIWAQLGADSMVSTTAGL